MLGGKARALMMRKAQVDTQNRNQLSNGDGSQDDSHSSDGSSDESDSNSSGSDAGSDSGNEVPFQRQQYQQQQQQQQQIIKPQAKPPSSLSESNYSGVSSSPISYSHPITAANNNASSNEQANLSLAPPLVVQTVLGSPAAQVSKPKPPPLNKDQMVSPSTITPTIGAAAAVTNPQRKGFQPPLPPPKPPISPPSVPKSPTSPPPPAFSEFAGSHTERSTSPIKPEKYQQSENANDLSQRSSAEDTSPKNKNERAKSDKDPLEGIQPKLKKLKKLKKWAKNKKGDVVVKKTAKYVREIGDWISKNVKDGDKEIWEKATKLAGNRVSGESLKEAYSLILSDLPVNKSSADDDDD